MVKIKDIFSIEYGKLKIPMCKLLPGKMPVVSSGSKNNGVAGLFDTNSIYNNVISVPRTGTICYAFYHGYNCAINDNCLVLSPIVTMTANEMIYYALLLRKENIKYVYGRQVTPERLGNTKFPEKHEIPSWVHTTLVPDFSDIQKSVLDQPVPDLLIKEWKSFRYDELFDIQRGLGPRKKDLQEIGSLPFISSINKNNGVACFCNAEATHNGNVITVNRNGSVGEAFYQSEPFCTTEDVHVFNPKFSINPYIALFLCALIRKERFRYNYGRKWGLERMNQSIVKLPVGSSGNPDWEYIETYMKTLKYSRNLL